MSDNVYSRLGLAPVINGAGKMTALGGSAQTASVASAQADAAAWHVDLQALRDIAGVRIASHTGAEAACVTTGAAAGIAISVAACITGTRLDRILALPDSTGLVNRVLLQAGHDVNFGAAVTQMVRLGGGRVTRIGWANSVPFELLDNALNGNALNGNALNGNALNGNALNGNASSGHALSGDAFNDSASYAAFLYVQSHHAVQSQMISLDECIAACHRRNLPVIVDAAAEEDLRRYIDAGADLVTYSGGKAFGGPTAGFICGRHDLIEACELQSHGIARAMKVGKEQIAGLLTALDAYASRDIGAEHARRSRIVGDIVAGLRDVKGLRVFVKADEAGRGIERVALQRDDDGDIRDLVSFLRSGTPSIRTRNHHLDEGVALLDPRELAPSHVAPIIARVSAFFAGRP